MKLEHEFSVAQPVAKVWEALQDVPSVADCLPGAELTGETDDAYEGKVSVRLGPMTAVFEGTATIEADETARRAEIKGKGTDRRGGSRGQVAMTYALKETDPDNTDVAIDADITLSGPAAQFGRTGLINEISRRLIDDFVACLEGKLTTDEEPTEPATATDTTTTTTLSEPATAASKPAGSSVDGVALFASSLLTVVRRFLAKLLRSAAEVVDPD